MDPSNTLTSQNPQFRLTSRQEELLSAALNSNKNSAVGADTSIPQSNNQSTTYTTMALGANTTSPLQQAPGSATLDGFEPSPYMDNYDYDFGGEGDFDYNFANDSSQMIGGLPGTSSDGENDLHDKRGHPDDDDDNDEGGGKRREGDEKQSKKPGRKPLTSEPTSKRKAQNRAAQRAFRERKEKHLKDLETKVEDLEKASESANHENSILRAQIEKMSVELSQYRKQFSSNGTRSTSLGSSTIPSYLTGKGLNGISNPSDVNFSFEFPTFGKLPGPPQRTTSNISSPSDLSSPGFGQNSMANSRSQSLQATGFAGQPLTQSPTNIDAGNDMSALSGLFSPGLLASVSKSPDFDFFANTTTGTNGSRSSTDSNGHNTSYSSPSAASSNGQNGPSSSCGTSPEPTLQSPHVNKPLESTLSTIGEEKTNEGELTFCQKLNMACGNPKQPIPRTMSKDDTEIFPANQAFDFNGIDWLAQQNNNQFDPQLFGDYREPQDSILAGDAFGTDTFFSDAFAFPEFQTPASVEPSPAAPKKDLLTQIDRLQEEEVVPAEDRSKMLNCNTIWDRLQACPKVKDGEFDLDLLCKDLQKKAKCSETGAVVNESDFNHVLNNHVKNKNATAQIFNTLMQ